MENYYYLNSRNEQTGPIAPSDFTRYCITGSTMVWKQGLPNWMRADQVPELKSYLLPSPPPPTGNVVGGFTSNVAGNNGIPNGYPPQRPDNNLVWAILSTILCCLPCGIYAIIEATKVNSLYDKGQYLEAQKKADNAKQWSIIGAVAGIIFSIIYAIIIIASS